MGIILEDALKYPGFDIKNKKISIDGDKKKVYIDSSDVAKMFAVNSKSSGIVKGIIMPKYNPNINYLNTTKIEKPVDALGSNIMFEDALPEDKQFMHDLIKVKYNNPNLLNNIPAYQAEQNINTFDELDLFIKKNILNNKSRTYNNGL